MKLQEPTYIPALRVLCEYGVTHAELACGKGGDLSSFSAEYDQIGYSVRTVRTAAFVLNGVKTMIPSVWLNRGPAGQNGLNDNWTNGNGKDVKYGGLSFLNLGPLTHALAALETTKARLTCQTYEFDSRETHVLELVRNANGNFQMHAAGEDFEIVEIPHETALCPEVT